MHDIIPPKPDLGPRPEDSLKAVSYCPVCQHPYNPMQAKVIDESEGAHLVHIRCHRCKSAILALILTNNFGISSVGLVTDLDSYEINRFKESSRVSSDDVLSVYEYLSANELDIEKI